MVKHWLSAKYPQMPAWPCFAILALAFGCLDYFVQPRLPLIPVLALGLLMVMVVITLSHVALTNFRLLVLFLLVVSITLPVFSRLGVEAVEPAIKGIKFGGLFMGAAVWYIKRMLSPEHARMSRPFIYFSLAFLASLLFFVIRAAYDLVVGGDAANIFTFLQTFSFPYLLLTFIFYFETSDLRWVERFCRFLVLSGVLVALFGIFQWIAGPDVLTAMGFDLVTKSAFVYDETTTLNASDNIFRAFSSLQSGAEFSTFMIVTVLAGLQLYLTGVLRFSRFIIATGLMIFGLLATQFMSSLICLLTAVGLGLLMQRRLVLRSAGQPPGRKKTITIVVAGFVVLGALIAANPKFLYRIINTFILGQVDEAGMQTSLFSRVIFLVNNLQAIASYPQGMGFSGDMRGYLFSADNYLLYLTAMGGIPMMAIYGWVYLLPPLAGWRASRAIAAGTDLVSGTFYSLLWGWICTGLLVGTLSNSHITQGSPSNILFWSAVGVFFKIPLLSNNNNAQNGMDQHLVKTYRHMAASRKKC